MVMEETYLLTKHANFTPEYVENIPVYKRRYHLDLLKKEIDIQKKQHEKAVNKSSVKSSPRRR